MCHLAKISSVVTTHGLAITDKFFRALDPSFDRLRFSLDGQEQTHNHVRGGPFFHRTLAAMKRAAIAGFQVEANITLLHENIEQLPSLIAGLEEYGVGKVVLLSFIGRESALENGVMAPTTRQLLELEDKITEIRRSSNAIAIQMNNYSHSDDRYVVIEADGEILLCSSKQGELEFGSAIGGVAALCLALGNQNLAHRSEIGL
jgi:MoaA/NifB/PqqE/SkfB family radical SAM enzyme